MNPYQQYYQLNNGFSNNTPRSFGNTMPMAGIPSTSPSAPQLGYPNVPDGHQLPQGYSQMPQGCLQMPQACPQIRQSCPQMPQGYPQSSPYQGYTPIPTRSFPSQAFPQPAPIGFRQTSLPQETQVYPQPNQFEGHPSSPYMQSQSQLACSMPGVPKAHYHH